MEIKMCWVRVTLIQFSLKPWYNYMQRQECNQILRQTSSMSCAQAEVVTCLSWKETKVLQLGLKFYCIPKACTQHGNNSDFLGVLKQTIIIQYLEKTMPIKHRVKTGGGCLINIQDGRCICVMGGGGDFNIQCQSPNMKKVK